MTRRDLFKYLLVILMPAVLWLFVNATINRHNHYLAEGYAITHAHPYDKTPSNPTPLGSHQHNGTELFLLSLVSDSAATTVIIFLLVLFLLAVMQLINFRDNITIPFRVLYQIRNYHAPPAI